MGDSGDPVGGCVSLWSGSRPTSAGLAGDSPSAIWPVHEGAVLRRKCGPQPTGESARARQRATTPLRDSLQFAKTRDREFSPVFCSAIGQPEPLSPNARTAKPVLSQSLGDVVRHRLPCALRQPSYLLDQLRRQSKSNWLVAGSRAAGTRACAAMSRQNLGPNPATNLDRFICVGDSLLHRTPCLFSSSRHR